ncbi:MAG: YkgJ family cysteine cluster protein [Planctomycetales bacterium]|nr:YkgJ family cysteine cluster protein [Planctomycetales bacterium]
MATVTATQPQAFGATRIRREDLPKGGNLCEHCTAKCCRYLAVPYETPTERADMEYIRWIVLHHGATFFIDNDDWYLLVHTECEKLGEDNRCGAYETRPQICRDYTSENCEYDEDWTYDFYLETHEQVWEYTEARFQKKGDCIRGRKPDPLAVLA